MSLGHHDEPRRAEVLSGPRGGGLEFLDLASGDVAARSPWQLFWRRLRQDRVAIVSGGVHHLPDRDRDRRAAARQTILGLPGPNVAEPQPDRLVRLAARAEHGAPVRRRPARARTSMSRVIYGTRVSLEVGHHRHRDLDASSASSSALIAGFYRGWVDTLLSRTVDVVLSIPILLLGIGIGAACAVKGCLGGTIQPGHRRDHLPDRVRHLALHGEDRARARAVAARARVRRGLARARGARTCASCSARSCPT